MHDFSSENNFEDAPYLQIFKIKKQFENTWNEYKQIKELNFRCVTLSW